jgi:hypothetical protein
VDIEPGLLIPYNGKIYEEYDGKSEYALEIKDTGGGVDADPNLIECRQNMCIASLFNEASPGENYNCFSDSFENSEPPIYPHFNKKICPFLVVAVAVKKGEQLFWHYGDGYERNYTTAPYDIKNNVFSSKNDFQFLRTLEAFIDLRSTHTRMRTPVLDANRPIDFEGETLTE